MGVLQRFERRIESLVNRPFAKAFKAEVQPVEVASALQRELDDHAQYLSRDRTLVPNVFVVELGQHDFERLSPYDEPLTAELADMVREHADEQSYAFVGPVSVALERVDDLDTGIFRIRSTGQPGAAAAPPPPPAEPAQQWAAAPNPAAATSIVRQPPAGAVEINGQRLTLGRQVSVLGRAVDVDVRVDDPGVSRHHAELRLGEDAYGTALEVVDLGSTNGLHVGDRRVPRATLRDGDRFLVGQTTVIFRAGGG